jgi:hypothetical protein
MKSITRSILVVAMGVLMLASISCKKSQSSSDVKVTSAYQINFTPAKTPNELRELQANKNANLIRTLSDFDAVVASGSTPFSKLSPTDLEAFRSSLVVRDGLGIVGLQYGVLLGKMSYNDFSNAFAAFGLDIKKGFWGVSQDPEIVAQLADKPAFKVMDGGTDDEEFDPELGGGTDFSSGKDYYNYYCYGIHTCKKASTYWCMSGC